MSIRHRRSNVYCPLNGCASNFNQICSATEQTGVAPVGMPNVDETPNLFPDMWNSELSVMPVRYSTPPDHWDHWEDCPFAKKYLHHD